jgi:hypothetical protein
MHPQVVAGTLQDPNGTPLPGIGIQLLSGKKIVQDLRTTNQGAYDFGQVPPGKYRIRIHYGDDPFCAPAVTCTAKRCTLNPRLKVNPKSTIIVN